MSFFFRLNKHAPEWLSEKALEHPSNNRIRRVYIHHEENDIYLNTPSQNYINEQLRKTIRDSLCGENGFGPFDFQFANDLKGSSMFTLPQTISLPLHTLALQIGDLCGYSEVSCRYMKTKNGSDIIDVNTRNRKTNKWEGWEKVIC